MQHAERAVGWWVGRGYQPLSDLSDHGPLQIETFSNQGYGCQPRSDLPGHGPGVHTIKQARATSP